MNASHFGSGTRAIRRVRAASALALIALAAAWAMPGTAAGQPLEPGCSLEHGDGAGPFDYRNERGMLGIVEKRHFTKKVENLVSGESTSKPGPDIAYTLNKFPNHHRALAALSALGQKLQVNQVPDMQHTVTCYFERAVRFRPNDTVARLLYARHLGAVGRAEEGRPHLGLAASYAKDNPLTHYNIGLVALELKDYERALEHAHIAHALGVTAPGLRNQLAAAGKWAEPTAKGTPAAPPAGGAPASTGARTQ